MPYKRNPMRCERICSLARYVIADGCNPAVTAATQWFERTLDDSANKRISVPEAFLAVDAILNIYRNVASSTATWPPAWWSTPRSSRSTCWRSCPSWPARTS